MRTYNELESPTRRRAHLVIGVGVISIVYTLLVALVRFYFL